MCTRISMGAASVGRLLEHLIVTCSEMGYRQMVA
jgi:hypothetical protein